jgi:hypothetical protein
MLASPKGSAFKRGWEDANDDDLVCAATVPARHHPALPRGFIFRLTVTHRDIENLLATGGRET